MDRRVTSPTRGPPTSCKQALSHVSRRYSIGIVTKLSIACDETQSLMLATNLTRISIQFPFRNGQRKC